MKVIIHDYCCRNYYDDDDDPPEIFWFVVQQPPCGMIRLIFCVQTVRSDGMFATYSTRGSEPTYIMAV